MGIIASGFGNSIKQHLISSISSKATLIDNTDVHTLFKLGKLALQLKALDIAEYAFENCLARNDQHILAAEGILKVYTLKRNIVSAYHWAVKIYTENPRCRWALEVIREITTLMGDDFRSIEQMTCPLPEHIKQDCLWLEQKKEKSSEKFQYKWIFDSNDTQMQKDTLSANIQEGIDTLKTFRIKSEFSWSELGEFICNVYKHFKDNGRDMLFNFTLEDIIDRKDSCNQLTLNGGVSSKRSEGLMMDLDHRGAVVTSEFSNSKSVVENVSPTTMVTGCGVIDLEENRGEEGDKSDVIVLDDNEDSGSDGSEVVAAVKPKTKRRCSDLHFLEQWGWHKNRRYTSRKKTERDEVDTTLNGFLRKIFTKYTK